MNYLKIEFCKNGEPLFALIMVNNELTFLKNDGFLCEKVLENIFLGKKKNLYFCVWDLGGEGFFLLNFIFRNKAFSYETVFFDLEFFLLKIKHKNSWVHIYSVKKLWPDEMENICRAFDEGFLLNLNSDLFLKKVAWKGFNETDSSTKTALCKTLILKKAVEVLNDIFKKFNMHQIKNNIISASSFSYKCFFKNFNIFDIKNSISENVDMFVRKSYFGGRCEVFGNPLKNDKIYHYDYVGMYSQCMEQSFPTGDGCFVFDNIDLQKPGFYDITFESNMEIPVLPIKNDEGCVFFCNGIMRNTYWFEEIILFLEMGGKVLKVHGAYVFKNQECVFKNFVEEFSSLRKTNPAFKKLGKFFINSLYGRFAMQKRLVKTAVLSTEEFLNSPSKDLMINKCVCVGDCWVVEYAYWAETSGGKSNQQPTTKSNIIYASIIASKARIKLYKTFLLAANMGCDILYCDTDSVFVSSAQQCELKLDNVVGNDTIRDAIFIGPRTFVLKYLKNGDVYYDGMGCNELSFEEIKEEFYKEMRADAMGWLAEFSVLGEAPFLKKNLLGSIINKRKFIDGGRRTKPLLYKNGILF